MTCLHVTPAAWGRIGQLVHKYQSQGAAHPCFRIQIDPGGCSGFQYRMAMAAEGPEPDDTVIVSNEPEVAGVVAIDATSVDLLAGSELDYDRDLGGARFVVRNPQAEARCGCGNSFSIGG